ncbi:Charged multivesicular body protein 6 [Mycena venus]|uniref:Charged multivesicular body protein 6 n=1 Tax=Mycena venus TaxID=2733690 RepID=A0A8H6XX42_9AGAR|nr:Charged multivesicular body protein 6 [Mycena venus]
MRPTVDDVECSRIALNAHVGMGTTQSTPKITAQDRAILDLKLQRDKLKQYQKKASRDDRLQIQVVLEREHAIAKTHLAAGNKDRAVIALRRRKYQQSLLLKTDGQLETLEELVSTIEFSLVEVSVLHGLKQGNEVLKEIHKEMNIESVEKLMDETQEAREYQREIGELLANNLTADEEDAVQEELRQLQLEATQGEAVQVELPSVPTYEPIPEPTPEPARNEARERVPLAA